jgi:CheY-like chemotaxis protein
MESPLNGITILVVEDDPDTRELLRVLLQTNGGTVTAVHKAFTMITGGADVLDSVIAGVNIVELDPLDDSSRLRPTKCGRHCSADSSCMHGPKKRAGAVGLRTPRSWRKQL